MVGDHLTAPRVMFYVEKVCFTLAEVLITLGIISIVAAMAMPFLIDYWKCDDLNLDGKTKCKQ